MNKRANEFLELYNSGLTLQQIGNKYNISRQKAHKILSSHPDYISMSDARRKLNRNEKIIWAYDNLRYLRVAHIAKMFNVGEATVYRVVKGKARRHKENSTDCREN